MHTEELFIEAPTFKKVATKELSSDPTNWEVEVTQYVHEQMPFVAEHQLGVQFDQVDDKSGYGLGYLSIGGPGQTKVSAPLLVKEFQLFPVDVFIKKTAGKTGDEEEFFPLNEDRLEEALFSTGTFEKTVPPTDSTGGYSQNYPPHSGKYVYASAKGSLLEAIRHTVSETDKNYFLDKLAQDDSLRALYQDNGHLDTIRKVASMGRPASVAGSRPVHRALTPNVVQIIKVGFDQFKVRAVSDQMYSPMEVELSGDAVIEKFGQDVHTHILDNNEYCMVQGRRPVSPVVVEGIMSEMSKLTKYGPCVVQNSVFDRLSGWLFPKVINMDGTDLGDKLFTDGATCYGMQQDIVGQPLEDSLTVCDHPPHCEIQIGVTGVFYKSDGEGRAFCTLPVTITSPVCDLGDMLRFEVCTALGECLTLEITPSVESIMPSRRDKYVRYIPASMRFCKVGNMEKLQDNPDMAVKHAANLLKTAKGSLRVSSDNDGQNYTLSGTDTDALEGGTSRVTPSQAKFHLMAMGMNPSDAKATLHRAACNGNVTLSNLQPLLTEHEKQAQVSSEVLGPLLSILPSLKTDLVKEAGFMSDEDTVDSVLSLNFINMENLKTFIDFIPELKTASSKTAQLLVASRLGFGTVPEKAAKNAMENLERVIMNLENLSSATQKQRMAS